MDLARLAVIAGPDLGAEFAIDDAGGAIGRASDCVVKLTDPTVSRVQARLEVRDGALHLRAEAGPNPLRVNGASWAEGRLRDGDRLELGRSTLMVLAPDGGVVPAVEAARTLATLTAGRGPDLAGALLDLAAAWRDAHDAAAIAAAACATALGALGGRRAAVLLADAGGTLTAVARAPVDAVGAVALAEADVAAAVARRALVIERGGRSLAIAELGDPARRGLVVVEAPHGDDALARLAAIAALLGAQLAAAAARARSERARASLVERTAGAGLIGASPGLARLRALIAKVASTDATVMITGESGTGKEKVAEAIHAASARAGGPLVAVNCAALPDALIESELFGHERGAFTGAVERRVGRFEQADGGTLFLDEIGELSEPAQARLLRVLETRRFERVGGARTVAVDVRLIAATHRDLEERVRAGKFREDLFYRVCVVRAEVPPLRDRPEDVVPLAEHFLARYAQAMGRAVRGFSDEARAALTAHWWPGNVRELRNTVERAVVMADGPRIELDDLAPLAPAGAPPPAEATLALDALERDAVVRALEASGGNKSQAAQKLGIDRTTLYKKLRRLGLG